MFEEFYRLPVPQQLDQLFGGGALPELVEKAYNDLPTSLKKDATTDREVVGHTITLLNEGDCPEWLLYVIKRNHAHATHG